MKLHKILAALLLTSTLLLVTGTAQASPPAGAIVNMAELDIDPTQVEAFKAAAIEEMDDSVRLEPGVYAIYAVAHKNNPAKFVFFEIYASQEALKTHRDTPHFQKFLNVTKGMIQGRRIVETNVMHLSSKP